MGNIVGMHDLFPEEKDWLFGTGGAFSPGWILHTVNVRDKASHDYSARVERGYKIMARLNNGYGAAGTIPAGDYGKFAEQCARFVQRSTGLRIAIIGNEPNHENERPQGKIIPPADYSACFNLCYDAIKAVAPSVQVIPAAVAPYHADPMKWTDYLLQMLNRIEACDGISVHAYTRGHDAAYVRSSENMAAAPLQGTFRGFLTYRDALMAVPQHLHDLPAYLTECNPVEGWPQHNAHLISAMLQEIRRHNETARVTNKFHAMITFRWHDYQPHPEWGIVRSEGTQQDFSEAASMEVFEPERKAQPASGGQHNIFFPSIPGPTEDDEPSEPSEPQPDGPDVDWDPKLTERGVTYKPTGGNPGEPFWGLIWARYIPPEEAEGRHAVYVEVLDKQGRLMEGVPIFFYWADGDETKPSKDRQGWEAQDFLLWASGNAYDLEIGGDLPSDVVRGMGMGTIEEPHIGHHVAYRLRFQQFIAPLPMQEPDVEEEPAEVEEPILQTEPDEADKWERSYAFTKRWEGGYQNVHNDKGNWTGGKVGVGINKGTNFGISAASYPHLDIKNLTREQAKAIYHRDYWVPSGAADLPWPACLIVFDTAVLHGVGRAQQWLAEVGPNPLYFAARRLRSYTGMDNWDFWGEAWTKRVADLLEEAAN